MKAQSIKSLFLLCGSLALSSSALAQNTAFTYQGRLDDGSNPATGLYDMRFSLHDSESGSAILGSALGATVPVTNGLFTVLLDFGSTNFNGNLRWLEVGVRPGGSSSGTTYTPQLPRATLTPTPYAIYAQKAGNVANGAITSSQLAANAVNSSAVAANAITAPKIADGQVVKSLNGLKDNVSLVAGANVTLTPNGNNLTIASAAGGFSVSGNNAYYTAGNIGIGTVSPGSKLDVVGNWDGEQGALQLRGNKPSIRFTGEADSGNQSWLLHLGSDGPGNLQFFRRTGPGAWANALTLGVNGNVGFGKTNPDRPLDVAGNGRFSGDLHVGHSFTLAGGFDSRANNGEFVIQDYTTPHGPFTASPRFVVKPDANVGIGTGSPSEKLHVKGRFLRVEGAGGEAAYMGGDGNGDIQVGSLNPSVSLVGLYNAGANFWMNLAAQDVSYWGQQNQLNVAENFVATVRAADFLLGYSGRRGSPGRALVDLGDTLVVNYASDWANTVIGGNNVSVCKLTITGGCDLAEPFQMSEEKIPEGSVVVIDEANPGRLKQATSAYDTRVAGIISGAGGVSPGIALKQEGVLDQGQNVALTGRVYVKADAGYGAIKPGDLLTTSDSPGHAMKVTEHTRAQGAILGKAMSALETGTGLVLALVTLQ